jgi:hypothetical protein
VASDEWREGRIDGRWLLGTVAIGGSGGPERVAAEIGGDVHGRA